MNGKQIKTLVLMGIVSAVSFVILFHLSKKGGF